MGAATRVAKRPAPCSGRVVLWVLTSMWPVLVHAHEVTQWDVTLGAVVSHEHRACLSLWKRFPCPASGRCTRLTRVD